MMTDDEKNPTLLRPFDKATAKPGDKLLSISGELEYEMVSGPDAGGMVCVAIEGNYWILWPGDLRMAPICWVDGKPVYKGEVLWQTVVGITSPRIVVSGNENGIFDANGNWNGRSHLTWTRPMVKREGWCLVSKGNISSSLDKVKADFASINSPEDLVIMHAEWEEES